MSLLANCELFLSYLHWMLFLALSVIYTLLRALYWRYTGLHARIVDNKQPHNYDESVQVLKIVHSHRLDIFMEARESDFILVHDRFVHPEHVLRDDVTLYTVTPTEAVFVQSKAGARPHEEDFYIIGQFKHAERILKMPLNHFTKLAESIEDDGGRIVVLQNQSRCGGTLLTNIFKGTGRCITFCEPHAYNAMAKHMFTNNVWTGALARRHFKNVVRMICKPYRGLEGRPLAYVMKPTVPSIITAQLLHDAMPDVLQFFIYRDPVEIATSLRRAAEAVPTFKLGFCLPNIPGMMAPMMRLLGFCDVDFRNWTPRLGQELEFGYRVACLAMYHIQMAQQHGTTIHCIRYRDLVMHRDQIISKFFDICGIPEELVRKAEKVLDQDSQRNSPLSRDNVQRLMPVRPVATPEFMAVARAMSEEFGVAGPEEFKNDSFRLPGSLVP